MLYLSKILALRAYPPAVLILDPHLFPTFLTSLTQPPYLIYFNHQAGTDNAEKKSYKLAKQRLGTHRRALRKRAEMQNYIASYNKARAAK